jgi:hypothetical protein
MLHNHCHENLESYFAFTFVGRANGHMRGCAHEHTYCRMIQEPLHWKSHLLFLSFSFPHLNLNFNSCKCYIACI